MATTKSKIMKITKKETSKIIDTVIKNNIVDVTDGNYIIHIQKLIDAQVASTIINSVVNACFNDDGTFDPNAKEFARRIALIMAYTDIEIPESAAEQYAFVYGTKYFDYVIEHANGDQIADIYNAIESSIEYRVRANTDALLGNIMKLYAEMNSVVSGMGNMYQDLSADKMAAFVQAVTDSKLDEKKLVEAIISEKE